MDRMMNNMNNMMNGMMGPSLMGSPFGMPGMPGMPGMNSLMNNHMQMMNSSRMNNQLAMFGGGMPNGNMSMMTFSNMPGQAVSYSSKVMTVSNDGSGKPQVYEKTSSQICGPNGIRETKETVRDSRSGLQQIKVGRHINDRGHLKQKKRNVYNGDEEEEEELVNLDEEEIEQFNNEYTSKSKDFRPKYQSIAHNPSQNNRTRLALTNGPSIIEPQQSCSNQSRFYNLVQEQDARPPSRGKKSVHKDQLDKKLKKKSKKPY